MALSSNWLKLQESKGVTVNKNKKKLRDDRKSYTRIEKPAKKVNKIMNMVYSMNEEILKHEQDKKDGKAFEFKTKEVEIKVIELPTSRVIDFSTIPQTKKAKEIGKFVAMDCEFVGTGSEGKDSALARISITNYFGHVILDEYVKSREKVTDWRTWVSGIKPEHMKGAITFNEAQKKCADVLEGRILVGHAIKHDLEALLLSHPKSMIRDTARHLPFRQTYAQGKSPSLKKLAKEVLKVDIQEAEHSSVEDARITMLIYKSDKKEFERLHRTAISESK